MNGGLAPQHALVAPPASPQFKHRQAFIAVRKATCANARILSASAGLCAYFRVVRGRAPFVETGNLLLVLRVLGGRGCSLSYCRLLVALCFRRHELMGYCWFTRKDSFVTS
jgi:hypothetical protein